MRLRSYLSRLLSHIKPRWRKIIAGTLITILALIVLVFVFISPIAKYLIEKYDEQVTGRQITLDWAYVNPFTGFVYLKNVDIYEQKKDTIFLHASHISADFALWKLFAKTYELSELTLQNPVGTFIQKDKQFNLNDVIVRFSPDSLSTDTSTVHLNILNISIRHGQFRYRDRLIPIDYLVKDLNLESPGRHWNSDTLTSAFSFLSQNGKGGIKGNFTINVKNQDYKLATNIKNFDLEIVRQYLWELINYGMFSAQLDADVKASGNFKNPKVLNMNGRIHFQDFHLGKTTEDDYFAFDDLVMVIEELSPMNNKFLFDSITVDHPFFKYEKFDSLNNIEMLFGKNGSNISDVTSQPGRFNLIIEIGRYLKKLTQNFFRSHYKIKRLEVKRGDFKYSDFSLSEQFSIETKSLSLRADSVDKNNKRITAIAKSDLNPYGNLLVKLSINPRDSGYFDMAYDFNKVPLTVFNPYLISITSYPLNRGTLDLNGVWNVRDGQIKSVNHLLVTDPRATARIKNKDVKWLPLPLIMAFVRERGNVIDYQIPITGNLKNPHFHLYDAITDIIANIFVKPATLPYGIELKTVENEIENSLTLNWELGQRELHPKQVRFLEKMSKFLEKNSEASLAVYPLEFAQKEKEYILFFEAKKKYFLESHRKAMKDFNASDSMQVDKMSVKDPALVHRLRQGIPDTVMFTIQEKCANFVGWKKVDARYAQLVKKRETEFNNLFHRDGTAARVIIHPHQDVVPFNGFSYFKIAYHGDLPKPLRKAYEEMRELNEENPRRKARKDLMQPFTRK